MRLIGTAAVLLLTASMALAGERGGRNADRLRDLNLTDAQKTRIAQLETQFREANRATYAANRAASKEYRQAKRSGDTAKAAALKPAVDARRAALKKQRESQQEQIRALLTTEQQAKWDARRKHGGRRGKG